MIAPTELKPLDGKRMTRMRTSTSAGVGARSPPCGVPARRPRECASGAQELSVLRRVNKGKAKSSVTGSMRGGWGDSPSFEWVNACEIDNRVKASRFLPVSDVAKHFFRCLKETRRIGQARIVQRIATLPYARGGQCNRGAGYTPALRSKQGDKL